MEGHRNTFGHALRWIAATLVALIAAVLVVSSVAARFARAQLLDTETYVATVAPLATDPRVQAEVTDRVTREVVKALPIAQLTAEIAGKFGVPRAADLVTPAITSWLTGQVHRIVGDLVTSPNFANLWAGLNRQAHQGLVNVLTGHGGVVMGTEGGAIVIDLGIVLHAAKTELVERGFSLAAMVPDRSIPYTVAQVDELPKLQQYVKWLNVSATWLPILALALLGLAVWIAPNRRRGLLLGLLLSALLLIVALAANQVLRQRVFDRAAARGLSPAVTFDVYDTVTRFLVHALATVLVAALLAALWTLLAGSSRPAVLLRRGVNRVLDQIGSLIGRGPSAQSASRVGAFLRRWQGWIALAIGLLAGWWLLARPTITTAIWAFVLAAVATALLTLVKRLPEPSPEPLPEPAETPE